MCYTNLVPVAQELASDQRRKEIILYNTFLEWKRFAMSKAGQSVNILYIRVYFHSYIVITLVIHMS